jgi:hypothetical protein
MDAIRYECELPVAGEYDVVVCGGGPAGIGAAVAAAECGASVALIERFGFPGGMATAGFVNPMSEFAYNGERVIHGIPWRFAKRLVEVGGGLVEEPRCNVSFDPEKYKLVAQRMLAEAGVRCHMDTFIADCRMDGKHLDAVIVANKNGLQAIRGHYFVDATGDADVAFRAGVPMLPQRRAQQPATLCFVLSGVDTSTPRMHIIHQKNHRFNHQAVFIRDALFARRKAGEEVPVFGGPWLATTLQEGTITVNLTRAAVNAVDNDDLQKREAQLREDAFRLVDMIRADVPEFRRAAIVAVGASCGIRESRRIRGVHVLTGEEYVNGVRFEDAVARSCHPVDIHLPGDEGQQLTFPRDAGYIPYRSLVPEKLPNLLVAGRAISADAEAFAATRVQAPCMETGQAAGTAAALCRKHGDAPVQQADVRELLRTIAAFEKGL